MENQKLNPQQDQNALQAKSDAGLTASGFDQGATDGGLQLAANTSAPVQQLRSLQSAANSSSQVSQLRSLQAGANEAPLQRQAIPGTEGAIQREGMDVEEVAGDNSELGGGDHEEDFADAPEFIVDPGADIHPDQIDIPTLQAIMYNWTVLHLQICPQDAFQHRFGIWYNYSRSVTRSEFRAIFAGAHDQAQQPAMSQKTDGNESPMQLARTPNTDSTQANYIGKNGFNYKNVTYRRDGVGNIDFTNPKSSTAWSNPQKGGSLVQLNTGSTQHRWGIMSSGKKVEIPKASRPQHFAIGDRLLPGNGRAGTWTWHHLSSEYHMVLVDMTVHAKHGHNGGVYVWK